MRLRRGGGKIGGERGFRIDERPPLGCAPVTGGKGGLETKGDQWDTLLGEGVLVGGGSVEGLKIYGNGGGDKRPLGIQEKPQQTRGKRVRAKIPGLGNRAERFS